MANFDTLQVQKLVRARGVYSGREQSVTGTLVVRAGTSVALTDLIRAVPVGENGRPIRVIVASTPISGTPVLTNPTFNVGVAPLGGTYTRLDGTTYPPLAASAAILSPALVLAGDNMKQDIEVARPVADSISNYGPFYVTLTPAGAGAFSVAGGDIELSVTVVLVGEENNNSIYTTYVNQKVSN